MTLLLLFMCNAVTGEEKAVAMALCDPALWMVHASLALLGGSFQVIYATRSYVIQVESHGMTHVQ